jgi:anti-sigma factor RsiW
MTTPSRRDLEQLSAYLDGQLSQSDRARLEIRIKSDAGLAAALEELRQTRAFLRRTPQRHAPRNFTLTPGMAGIRPPMPRLVPVLSWASAVAMLFFIFTLGAGLVGQLSLGKTASMNAAVPMGSGAGPLAAAPMAPANANTATMVPVMAAPAPLVPAASGVPATNVPLAASSNPPAAPTPTVEISIMSVEQATPPAVSRFAQSPAAPKSLQRQVNYWLIIWPGMAVILGASAVAAWGLNKRAFQRKNPPR